MGGCSALAELTKSLDAILARPLVNTRGKKEETHCSVTAVKSSEMELKSWIRLGLGQRRDKTGGVR